jgi:hypothetical protein
MVSEWVLVTVHNRWKWCFKMLSRRGRGAGFKENMGSPTVILRPQSSIAISDKINRDSKTNSTSDDCFRAGVRPCTMLPFQR